MPNGILLTNKTRKQKEFDPVEELAKLQESISGEGGLVDSVATVLREDYGLHFTDPLGTYAPLSRHAIEAQTEQILFRANERRRITANTNNTEVPQPLTDLSQLSPEEMRSARAAVIESGSNSKNALALLSTRGRGIKDSKGFDERDYWFKDSILNPVAHKINEQLNAAPIHDQFRQSLLISHKSVIDDGTSEPIFRASHVLKNIGHFSAEKHARELSDLNEFGGHLIRRFQELHTTTTDKTEKENIKFYVFQLTGKSIEEKDLKIDPKNITWKNGKPELMVRSKVGPESVDYFNTTLGVRTATASGFMSAKTGKVAAHRAVMPLFGNYTISEPAKLVGGFFQKSTLGIGFEKAAILSARAMLSRNPMKDLQAQRRRFDKDNDHKAIYGGTDVEMPESTVFHSAEMMQIP